MTKTQQQRVTIDSAFDTMGSSSIHENKKPIVDRIAYLVIVEKGNEEGNTQEIVVNSAHWTREEAERLAEIQNAATKFNTAKVSLALVENVDKAMHDAKKKLSPLEQLLLLPPKASVRS